MKESHYKMYMKNVETLDTTMGHHCAAVSITTKRNFKVDLGQGSSTLDLEIHFPAEIISNLD